MTPRADRGWAWRLGAVVQGLVCGPLLFFAILGLLALAGNAHVFRYQGY